MNQDQQLQIFLRDIAKAKELSDRNKKIDRNKVYGRVLKESFDDVIAALTTTQQAAPSQGAKWVPDMEHLANEWADAATNGPSYLDNVRDGIYTFEQAKEMMKRDFAHCREVGEQVRAALLEASTQREQPGYRRVTSINQPGEPS